jgi:putative serine protease PepD
MASRRLAPVVAAIASAGAVAGIAFAVASGPRTNTSTVQVVSAGPVPTALAADKGGLTINQIFRRDGPGVVDIKVTATATGPLGVTQETEDEGAGVVYDTKGDILTDEHVIAGARSLTVTFADGHIAGATVVGTDASTDVAVIRVTAPSSQLRPIPMANSASAQVGDPVVAIGSPFGLPETVTSGIVSGVARSIIAPNNFTIFGAIQTDAAINPGNSGGPLLDANGHVLGLADQIATDSTGLGGQGQNSGVGFATPSNTITEVAGLILAGKPVPHAYIGVSLSPTSTGGAEVESVEPNSPASNAGLKQGDLIIAVDGGRVASTEQLIEIGASHKPGQNVTLTIKRGGATVSVTLTLASRPKTLPGG